jgi:hypothetical protein
LNFFVLIVQLFLVVPALKALAPTQTEPAFVVTQMLTLATFLALGLAAVVRFRGGEPRSSEAHLPQPGLQRTDAI